MDEISQANEELHKAKNERVNEINKRNETIKKLKGTHSE
jgi:hypothetical protein